MKKEITKEYCKKMYVKTKIGFLRKDSTEDWKPIYDLYMKDKSINDLSTYLGVTYETVKNIFTNLKFNFLTREETLKRKALKMKQTCLEKYGVDSPLKCKEVRDKIKGTNLKKYGVEYAVQSEAVKNKVKKTCLEKYGVDHNFKNKECLDKRVATYLKNYGVENPSQCKEIQDKKKQTCLRNYGVENPNKSKEIRNKAKKTCLEKYGVEYSLQSKEVKNKSKKTCLEKYGVDNPAKCKEIRNKMERTCLERYGVGNPSQLDELRDRAKITEWGNTEARIIKLLEDNNYKFVDDFEGVQDTNIYGKYIAWKKYKIKHLECGTEYETSFKGNYFTKCPTCYPYQSNGELDVRNYIQELLPNANLITNTKNIIFKELDIYIKDLNVAFEYNGSYWHSTLQDSKSKNYHKNKTEACLNKNIKLFHIWDYDNIGIVKSLIKTKLNKIENKLFARKLTLKEIKTGERREFFNSNHLHGDVSSCFSLGLYNNKELVQCISFRKHKEGIEIARFATLLNTSVTGGFSRLLKHSVDKIKELGYNKIITYCDRDWTPSFEDSVYFKNGFTFVSDSGVQLKYTDGNKVISRESLQKHKLQNLFPDIYDENLIADEILSKKHIFPIYNSGNWKFELKI